MVGWSGDVVGDGAKVLTGATVGTTSAIGKSSMFFCAAAGRTKKSNAVNQVTGRMRKRMRKSKNNFLPFHFRHAQRHAVNSLQISGLQHFLHRRQLKRAIVD